MIAVSVGVKKVVGGGDVDSGANRAVAAPAMPASASAAEQSTI